jgi:ATP-binding cassette subfamily B (MDR/TAP) protein 1
MIALCLVTAIGAGIAMPLMFVVFGRLVGNFSSYFAPGTTVTQAEFMHQVRQNT